MGGGRDVGGDSGDSIAHWKVIECKVLSLYSTRCFLVVLGQIRQQIFFPATKILKFKKVIALTGPETFLVLWM